MKHLYSLIIACIGLLPLSAQNFHLLKDINAVNASMPNSHHTIKPDDQQPFAVLNRVAYFTADDGIHGNELWKSDGTTEGTTMVKDILPGSATSDIRNLTTFNNHVFFKVTTGLWMTDGTEAGTILLKDNVAPEFLTIFSNSLYFASGARVWKTDGTTVEMVIDLTKAAFDNSIRIWKLYALNNHLFISANAYHGNDGSGPWLWVSDGTEAGTYKISNQVVDADQFTEGPDHLIYFTAKTITDDNRKLWVTNGTENNAAIVTNSNNLIVSNNISIENLNSALYFIASSDGYHAGLYKYVPGGTGPLLVKDFSIDGQPADVKAFMRINDHLFYGSSSTMYGAYNGQLWKSDGTPSGTVILKDSCFPQSFSKQGSMLYFSGLGQSSGRELWKSDGTSIGTVMIADINPGQNSSEAGLPNCPTVIDDHTLLFAAQKGNLGVELWKSDGTAAGTQLVKDINQKSSGPLSIVNLSSNNGKLFFIGTDGITSGPLLWISDGTKEGTDSVPGLTPWYYDVFLDNLPSLGTATYFYASDKATGNHGLYKTDGTIKGTFLVKQLAPTTRRIKWMVSAGNLIYFLMVEADQTSTLWRSDGTFAGTFEIKNNIRDIPYSLFAKQNLVAVGNTLYFPLTNNDNKISLWKTEGTIASTNKILNTYSNPTSLCAYHGALYFSGARPNAVGNDVSYLVKTDGTEAGTFEFANVSHPYDLIESGGKLFFIAYGIYNGARVGQELWVIDSGVTTARLVKNINATQDAFSDFQPKNKLSINGRLFFFADDGIHGKELWISDGSEPGTHMVKDITPGATGTNPESYDWWYSGLKWTSASGKLCWVMNNQLWVSDGTDTGTNVITDENLSQVSIRNYVSAIDDDIFFIGYDYRYSFELYTGHIDGPVYPLYTFTGDGNFSDTANWVNGLKPPREIPAGVEVVIEPPAGKSCILDVPLRVRGGKLIIRQNAKIILSRNLQVQ